jgi:hypothetical protein
VGATGTGAEPWATALRPDPDGPRAAAGAARRALLLQLLVVEHVALLLEQNMQASVAERRRSWAIAFMRCRRPASSARSSGISWSCGSSLWLYTPPFADPVGIQQMSDGFPLHALALIMGQSELQLD